MRGAISDAACVVNYRSEGPSGEGAVTFWRGVDPAPGAPGEGDLGGGILDHLAQAIYLNTPMGQRPGE